MRIGNLTVLAFLLLSLAYLCSCNKESFYSGSNADFLFSSDTLRFDTVFTSVGSSTRSFKIFNPYDETAIVSNISLENPQNSPFRLNIDGQSTNQLADVKILPNDSIYVFVEVTINPDSPITDSPFVIEENVNITYNEESQQVLLQAWGQNAIYITDRDRKGDLSILSCNLGEFVLDDPKPYVIHGRLLIDSCKLVLPAGTQLYVHGGLVIDPDVGVFNDGLIAVFPDGSIESRGTADNPVTIQGDRLEEEFSDIPGQWVGIRFLGESKGNKFEHTIIKNSIVGSRVDSLAELELSSCTIANTSGSALVGFHAEISASNTQTYNNGGNAVQIVYGGNYSFDNCTFYNANNSEPAIYMDNATCQDIDCVLPLLLNPLNVSYNNCIVTGSNGDEILLIDASEDPSNFYNYQFNNSITRIDELLLPEGTPDFLDHCSNCIVINDNDSLFLDREILDLSLDTMSIAIDKGIPVSGIDSDIVGNPRDEMPDIGAFEFQK
jgi:hypothetical protein